MISPSPGGGIDCLDGPDLDFVPEGALVRLTDEQVGNVVKTEVIFLLGRKIGWRDDISVIFNLVISKVLIPFLLDILSVEEDCLVIIGFLKESSSRALIVIFRAQFDKPPKHGSIAREDRTFRLSKIQSLVSDGFAVGCLKVFNIRPSLAQGGKGSSRC